MEKLVNFFIDQIIYVLAFFKMDKLLFLGNIYLWNREKILLPWEVTKSFFH